MGRTIITEIRPVEDAIDRITWTVEIATDFWGIAPAHAFAFDWIGDIVFYREHVPSNTMPGPQTPRRSLPARWIRRQYDAQLHVPGPKAWTFETQMPPTAIDALESFRESGRLYARLEGEALVVVWDRESDPLADLASVMGAGHRVPTATIRSEAYELTRDLWCRHVLAAVRPPGRFVVEIAVATANAVNEIGERIMRGLAEAQGAFDEGRFPEVSRECYRVLDELAKLLDAIEERYGKLARKSFREQITELKSLCNPERHGTQPHHDGLQTDRPLAMHILATTSSLAGVLLR